MFQFTGLFSILLWMTGLDSSRVPPFGYSWIGAFLTAPHDFSQSNTSFFIQEWQGILRTPFLAWSNFKICLFRDCFLHYKNCLLFFWLGLSFLITFVMFSTTYVRPSVMSYTDHSFFKDRWLMIKVSLSHLGRSLFQNSMTNSLNSSLVLSP